MIPGHDLSAIAASILSGYSLPTRGYHGIVHWARVHENGIALAKQNGADTEIVTLFALFHDSRRVNEMRDDDHGRRGGELARSLRGSLVHLEDDRFEILFEACRSHTIGVTTNDLTIQTCWDADRLDLGRVGITPLPYRLGSDYAREMIEWANARAIADYEPIDVLRGWGMPGAANRRKMRGDS